ncbi:MAG: TorF family putative porin [Phycisphaeraceae bacterium]
MNEKMHIGRRLILFVALAGAATLGAAQAWGQEDGEGAQREFASETPMDLSFEAGVDVTSEYWFRGIGQQNEGLIVQPWAEIALGEFELGDEVTVSPYAGTWNSIHEVDEDEWFERDLYAGLAFSLPGGWGVDVSYVNLYSPAGDITFAEEIDLSISYDDSESWGLAPYALLAYETSGGSDAGTNEGTYLELGIEPSWAMNMSQDHDITLSVPVAVGLSLDDYYENPAGEDDTFGFVQVGLAASMPLDENWSLGGGVYGLYLGDTARDISADFGTGDDDTAVFGTVGVSVAF